MSVENFFKNNKHYDEDEQGYHLYRHILNQMSEKDDVNIFVKARNIRREARFLACI